MDDEEIDMMLAEAIDDIKDALIQCETNDPQDVRSALGRIYRIAAKAIA